MRAREDLVIAVAARVEEDLLLLIFLRVENIVAEIKKKKKFKLCFPKESYKRKKKKNLWKNRNMLRMSVNAMYDDGY